MEQRTAKQIQEALAKPFAAGDLEWRLQKAYPQEMRGIAVPYVTNRAIQYRLDDVVGVENWYNRFKPWHKFVAKVPGKEDYRKLEDKEIISQLCGIAIYFAERMEWVCKWDGAELSEIEPVKGGLSDSMKRAAYQWGIGRVLYDMNTVWVDIEKKGKTWFIRDDQRQKLDNAYLKLLDRLGLKPMPAGGTEALLVPKDIPEQEEDGAPPDAPGSVQSTPVPEQKPGAACSTQPAAPSAAPKGSTAKAEQAQVSSAAGSRSRTPSSAPSQNTYEYRVAASKVQKGMNTVNTLVRLEAADGKQVDAFAPGEHHALTVGTLLTGVRLSVRRQDTVVFYVLEDYRIATAPQAA